MLDGQGFLNDDVPTSEYPHWNTKINTNIELNLVNLNTISLQILNSMPKISAAKKKTYASAKGTKLKEAISKRFSKPVVSKQLISGKNPIKEYLELL